MEKLSFPEISHGKIGWLAVAALVSVIDIEARRHHGETMSYTHSGATNRHPLLLPVFELYLVGHLNGWVPEKWDFFKRGLNLIPEKH